MDYSLIVPIFNDGDLTEDFCHEVENTFRSYTGQQDLKPSLEVIFVNDGSKNETEKALEHTASRFSFVKVINLSRNFGQHIALSCGYRFAQGKYTAMLNVDMEDSPDQICKLFDVLKNSSCDIVHGLYEKRQVSLSNRITSYFFGIFLNKLTGYETPLNSSTARAMNRKFLNAYNGLSEKHRYIPGLEMWLGFQHAYIPIQHRPRKKGKSSYNFKRRLTMALHAIISFSDLPLKMIALAGSAIAILGLLMTVVQVIIKVSGVQFQPGYTMTTTLIVVFGGLQMLVTGLGSLYIGQILKEVQNRPLYLIRSAIGISATGIPNGGARHD